MRNHLFIALLTLAIFTAGCANKAREVSPSSGFLENYDLLQPVAGADDDAQFFTYVNPALDQKNYDAVIIEPVSVYRDPKHESELTRENIEKARLGIDQGLHREISKKYQVTDTPGPNVMRLKVAITGAYVEGEGFKIWNVIPVSAAITLASKATGLDSKKVVLVVELKFTDSQTKKLIKETVTILSGDNFRKNSNTSSQFETLSVTWAEEALPVF